MGSGANLVDESTLIQAVATPLWGLRPRRNPESGRSCWSSQLLTLPQLLALQIRCAVQDRGCDRQGEVARRPNSDGRLSGRSGARSPEWISTLNVNSRHSEVCSLNEPGRILRTT
jgi:hypothetical protein